MINSLVQCQLSYINTIDPNFVGGTSAIALVRLFSWHLTRGVVGR
jgi:hypothetical protein